MIRHKTMSTILAVAMGLMLLPLGACVPRTLKVPENMRSVASGEKWTVSKTTRLLSLTIAEGGIIKGPDGSNVTMTVDGVETGLRPGAYQGNIVLSVTPDIVVTHKGGKFSGKAAIAVENGKYDKEKSVTAAVATGIVTDTVALDVKITSTGDDFGGMIIRGNKTSFSILNPVISLTGKGEDDLAGIGAAIMSEGNAEITLRNASIVTRGEQRPGIVVRENSTINIKNSTIETYNGDVPEGKMLPVPGSLGLTGNNRTALIVGNGAAIFYNTDLKSEGWGVLTTDDANGAKISATNCRIETLMSGYGAYIAGDGVDTFSGCTFKISDYALIMADKGASALFTGRSTVNSKKVGVLIHDQNSGKLTIESGTTFNTRQAVIQVRSAFPTILVDDAVLNPECGVILQAMDDSEENERKDAVSLKSGVEATFRNTTLCGDVVSSMAGDLNITLESATLTGAISTATQKNQGEKREYREDVKVLMNAHADEYKETSASSMPYEKAKQTFSPADGRCGINVTLRKSVWVVEETSYLTGLTIAKGGSLRAPRGHHLVLTVNGVESPIGSGNYKGKIVIDVKR